MVFFLAICLQFKDLIVELLDDYVYFELFNLQVPKFSIGVIFEVVHDLHHEFCSVFISNKSVGGQFTQLLHEGPLNLRQNDGLPEGYLLVVFLFDGIEYAAGVLHNFLKGLVVGVAALLSTAYLALFLR